MARSQNRFIKKQKERKKQLKKKKKEERKKARKESSKGGELKDMLAYVNKDGNISSTPPEDEQEDGEKQNENKKQS